MNLRSTTVDLRPDHLATVNAILLAEVPDYEVWVFGSRAKWTAKDTSDLDLAIASNESVPIKRLRRLKRTFAESYLPLNVDVVDLSKVTPEFRELIEKQHVVLRRPEIDGAAEHRGDRGWRSVPLEESVDTIIDYRGKTPKKVTQGIPLITARIIKNGRIETPAEFISPDDYDEWMRRGIPKAGDVLLTMEAPLGEVAQLDDRKVALAQRVVAVRGKKGLLENDFLKYLLQSSQVQDQLKSRASGTTVQGIKQSELRKISLSIPPLDQQQAIAHTLGLLDKKIELNRRMNQTLEATALVLFKSQFIDSTQKGVPQGWRKGTLGDVAENMRRTVASEQIDPTTPYIGLEHMPRRRLALSEWGNSEKLESNKFAFKRGEILFGKLRPYFHKVGVAPIDGVCSTDILVTGAREPEWFGFVLGHISSIDLVNHTDAASTGTKMPRTNWQDIARFEIALPPRSLAAAFNKKIRPLTDRIVANIHESRTLAELRDALLPQLLSGKLRVVR
jgi:type I restriction enzyme, S subunit